MRIVRTFAFAAATVTAVDAGNPSNLRWSDSGSASSSKTFDFSTVNQVDQVASSCDDSGSGSGTCPETCPLDNKPVKDENGVEYLNECMLRLAQCTHSSVLAASDMADVRYMFGSLEGTVALDGSGSREYAVVDIKALSDWAARAEANKKTEPGSLDNLLIYDYKAGDTDTSAVTRPPNGPKSYDVGTIKLLGDGTTPAPTPSSSPRKTLLEKLGSFAIDSMNSHEAQGSANPTATKSTNVKQGASYEAGFGDYSSNADSNQLDEDTT